MSRADVSRYLLRLYASGKAPRDRESRDDRAAGPVGRFGVGFWSVLRFDPVRVIVESRRGGTSTAFAVDCDRAVIEERACTLARDGTRVTLVRRARSEEDLRAIVEEKLRLWCGPVTGLRGGPPPQLTLDGVVLNERLEPPKLIGERMKGRGFEGVVGLDRRPEVRLYSHGLLIRDVGSLEELLPRRSRSREAVAPGLHPVVRVNADGLEVLMNRQAVVEDQLLLDIVRTAERRLLRLRHRLLDRLAPLRLVDRLRVAWPRVSGLAALYVVAVLGGAAAVASLPVVEPSAPIPTRTLTETTGPRPLPSATDTRGPRINQPRTVAGDFAPWDIHVEGEGTHLLKIATHARYDDARGLVAEPPQAPGTYRYVPGGPDALAIDAAISRDDGAWMTLPIPAGYGVVRDSVFVDGRPDVVYRGRWGEPLLRAYGDRVQFRARPRNRRVDPLPEVGETPLPAERSRLSAERRARLVAARVPRVASYSTSPDDARRFDAARGTFVERVREVGRGDCDVMNAYAALSLRALDVPAHLAVGLVVEDGHVAIDLHAWTEYFDGERWRALDVSPPVELPTAPVVAAAGAAPAPARVIQLGTPVAGDAVERRPTSPSASSGSAPAPDDAERWLELPSLPALGVSATTRRWVLFGAGAAGSGVLLALLALLLIRPRGERLDEETLAELLVHHLRGPRGSDPLHLRHRPFFRTLAGRRLSLADLEQLAAAGKLFAAHPGERLLRYLRDNAPVLDRSDKKLEALLPLLPQVTRMRDLKAIVERSDAPAIADIERLLRELDPDVRVHLAQDREDVREVALPVAPTGLAPRHILVGAGLPAFRELSELHAREPALATYRLLRAVLDRTTLYRGQRDALLARAARQVLA